MSDVLDLALSRTEPLSSPRGNRMPMYVWQLDAAPDRTDGQWEEGLVGLDARGLGFFSSWDHERPDDSLERGLRIARLQHRNGLPVAVNANALLHRFCNGDPSTAHESPDGTPFFDFSFDPGVGMGCPFALEQRAAVIRERVESFAGAYRDAGLPVDIAFADWEIDGALEWNGAWEASRSCRRCKRNIPEIEEFSEFQKAIRTVRSGLQKTAFADVMRRHFPGVLVGNYGVYPNDGYRYWYDYYERFVEGAPYLPDHGARHRAWFQEFPLTGYTLAMPVVYPWQPAFSWYDDAEPDRRWMRAMLLAASNAPKTAPSGLPIVPFVHWSTVPVPGCPPIEPPQLSRFAYEELLWHMLLRGCSSFFLWCNPEETSRELGPVHEVYRAAHRYRDFLQEGSPVTFEIPREKSPVVSALLLGDRLLVRRTDLQGTDEPARLTVGGRELDVPPCPGRCEILSLSD